MRPQWGLWLLLVLGDAAKASNTPDPQWDALRDLFNATGGHKWLYNYGWFEDVPYCRPNSGGPEWYGVYCNGDVISMLVLQSNNLVGTIPASFGKLAGLSVVELSGNLLEGTLPDVFGHMEFLQTVDFSTNRLEGTLPRSLFTLESIETITLHTNHFTGRLPEFNASALLALATLELHANDFTGPLPKATFDLLSLDSINFSSNRLNGTLPLTSKGFKESLNSFKAANNSLSGTIPEVSRLMDFQYVGEFDVDNNLFTGILPDWLACTITIDCNVAGNAVTCQKGCSGANCIIRVPHGLDCNACVNGTCVVEPSPTATATATETKTRTASAQASYGATATVSPPPPAIPASPPPPNRMVLIGVLVGAGAFVLIVVVVVSGVAYRLRASKNPQAAMDRSGYGPVGGGEGGVAYQIGSKVEVIPWKDLEILGELGRGGSGTVYKGRWRHTEIAIKVLRSVVGKQEVQQFVEEATVLSELKHPNVVLCMGVCLEPTHLSIVTEYMRGGDLHDIVYGTWDDSHVPPLPHVRKLRILHDAALGLEYLHGRGMPHRDVKLRNILLDDRHPQTAKLADFGLSGVKMNSVAGAGTERYCAPEVLRGEEADDRADVYSFGVVLFEVLTRRMPNFSVDEQAMPLECPPELATVIVACWSKSRRKRPQITQVLEVLEKLFQAERLLHPDEGGPRHIPDRSTRTPGSGTLSGTSVSVAQSAPYLVSLPTDSPTRARVFDSPVFITPPHPSSINSVGGDE